MMDFDRVLELIEAMNREEVEYILFGALALNTHGIIRTTTDADFFVRPTAENIERLRRALRSVWNDPHIEEITVEDLAGDYPAIQYGPPDEEFGIDFLSRLGEAFSYDTLHWEMGTLGGVAVRVVTPAQLYEMKRDTVRDKDKIDADGLRRKFSLGDE